MEKEQLRLATDLVGQRIGFTGTSRVFTIDLECLVNWRLLILIPMSTNKHSKKSVVPVFSVNTSRCCCKGSICFV